MNLSLVLIIYRSNSLTAKEASIFCNKTLKDRNIKSKSIESDFDNNQLENYFYNIAKPTAASAAATVITKIVKT